jgi:carbamoyltransferase
VQPAAGDAGGALGAALAVWHQFLGNERTADGKHDLWMRVGGSAGHCGDYNLAIDEGQMDGNGDGRKFDVQVRTMAEVIDAENKEPKQSGSKKGQDASKRIIGALKAAKRQMLTLSDIKKKAHVSSQARELIDALIEEGVVEPCKITKRAGPAKNRPYDGYRLTRSRD